MTRRVLVATRLAFLLLAVTTAAGCTHAPAYRVSDDDDDDEDKPGGDSGEE